MAKNQVSATPANLTEIVSTGKKPDAAEAALWRAYGKVHGAKAANALAVLLHEHAVKTALTPQNTTTTDTSESTTNES